MAIQATVTFFKNEFIANLSDGKRIEQQDLNELAEALYRAGVHAGAVQYEWNAGQRMITAGQQVALRAAIRHKEDEQRGGLSIAA
jgi:hypothetical protein